DQTVLIHDATPPDEKARPELVTLGDHKGGATAVAFSPDGRLLASTAGDGTLRLFDTSTWKLVHALPGHKYIVLHAASPPQGRHLASAGPDQTIQVWDVVTGTGHIFGGHATPVSVVAYTPDGHRLASGGYDATIKVWDVATGVELHTLHGHTNPVQ